MKLKIFFVFSLSSGNISQCFGELEQAVKTRSAGVKCDYGFRFLFFFLPAVYLTSMATTKDIAASFFYTAYRKITILFINVL